MLEWKLCFQKLFDLYTDLSNVDMTWVVLARATYFRATCGLSYTHLILSILPRPQTRIQMPGNASDMSSHAQQR